MTEIRIEVPDGLAALFLSERLTNGAVVDLRNDHTWEVRVAADGQAEEVLDKVAGWLRFQRLDGVTVYVDGESRTLRAE